MLGLVWSTHRPLTFTLLLNKLSAAMGAVAEPNIIERGSHAQLMALDGHYARMFSLQAEGYR